MKNRNNPDNVFSVINSINDKKGKREHIYFAVKLAFY